MMKVGIFGTGAYGLALSSVLLDNNVDITMWTKFEDEKRQLESERKNDKLLPGYILDDSVKITTSIEECIANKDLLVIAIPAAFVSDLCLEMKKYFKNHQHICIASKGIEQDTGLFLHEIIKNHIDTKNIAVISGPSFAKDIIEKKPIGLSLATTSETTEKIVSSCFSTSNIKLLVNSDIIGTEVSGAIKNVIAIAAGMLDGLGANDSTRAMFITESIYYISRIIKELGGKPATIISFAGCGDLLLTCTSENSRNYSFGKLYGKKTSAEEIKNYIDNTTVEGYYTLKSIYQLLHSKNINIKIIDIIYDIVSNNKDVEELFNFLVENE